MQAHPMGSLLDQGSTTTASTPHLNDHTSSNIVTVVKGVFSLLTRTKHAEVYWSGSHTSHVLHLQFKRTLSIIRSYFIILFAQPFFRVTLVNGDSPSDLRLHRLSVDYLCTWISAAVLLAEEGRVICRKTGKKLAPGQKWEQMGSHSTSVDLKVDGRGCLNRINSKCCVLGLRNFLSEFQAGYLRPCAPCGPSLVHYEWAS